MTIQDTYVDNVATGKQNDAEAIEYYQEMKDTFGGMSMNLREWGSNSATFMNHLPEEDKVSSTVVKVLGLDWDRDRDTLSISTKEMEKCRLRQSVVY